MNNRTRTVLASISLSLLSLSSLEARDNKECRKCLDPIVGTWNISVDLRRVRLDDNDVTLEETEQPNGLIIPLEGVGTLCENGTVSFVSSPKKTADKKYGTTSIYGTWKNTGKGCYKIILSSVTNQPGTKKDFRGDAVTNVKLTHKKQESST